MMITYRCKVAKLHDTTATPETPHQDLVDAIAREAENVALFLQELGIVPSANCPTRLPQRFLFHLGAALRLLVWESGGLRVHQDSGLPMPEPAIIAAFGLLDTSTDPETQQAGDLTRRVIALFADRFAWHGRRDLDSDVELDDHVDEKSLVDALAELLWNTRRVAKHVKGDSDG